MANRKARFWDTIDKRMIYETDVDTGDKDYPVLLAIGIHGLPISITPDSFKQSEIVGWNRDHNLIRLDSTGLKDKNGVEIYEGDVFPPTERTRGEVSIVCYDSNQGRYKAVPLILYKANAGNGGWTGYDLNQFSEIIGNIHEHPHLIKEA